MARLTLWGMQQYNPNLLSGINLPPGMSTDSLKQLINYQIGDLYPYCQSPDILQNLITAWYGTRAEAYEKMYAAIQTDYAPLENYDRKEERTLKTTHSGTDTDTNTLGTSVTLKRSGTEESLTTGSEQEAVTGTDQTNVGVSAYDSSSYQPKEESTRTPNLTTTRTPDLTEIRTPDLTDVSTNSGSDVKKTDYGHVEDAKEEVRAHGNIGVTTSQQMLESEISLRRTYDLYQIIIGEFDAAFMSRIY